MIARVFRIFWTAEGGRPVMVIALMLLAGLSDLFGMGALVPIVAQLTADGGQKNSSLARSVLAIFNFIGVEPSFNHLLLFVGTGLVLKSVIAMASLAYVGVSVADVTTKIRARLLNALVQAEWAYFTERKPGEATAQIALFSTQAGQAYSFSATLMTNSISALALFFAAALVSPALMLFSVFAIAVLIVPLNFILHIAERASQSQFQSANLLTSELEDVVNNMKPLKSMGRQSRFVERFNTHIDTLRGSQIRMVVSRLATYYGQDILASILVLFGVWIGVGWLHTPLSQFLVFGVVFYQMIDIIKRTQQSLQDAVQAAPIYDSVFASAKASEARAEASGGILTPSLLKAIRFEDISFAYGTRPVLSHFNAEIPAGGITVLIGQSGAGKTTLIDLLVRLNSPTKGRILVDGVDLSELNLQAWRGTIGYVPQELTLLRGTVGENIALGDASISADEIKHALQLAGAQSFVDALPHGLDTDIGTMGAKLSGGQRQRLSLARALVHKPKLLLLDEVTSALDEATEAEICNNIQDLGGGLTIIAITHRPAWKNVATKVYSVAHGKATLETPKSKPRST